MGDVKLTSVTRRYRAGSERITVLDCVDLHIPAGSFCALSGPSGSGKSTLLNLIGGLDRPDDGRVELGGTDMAGLNDRRLAEFRARTLGFVFQSFHLLPVLTAAENVAWPLFFQGIRSAERMRRAREILGVVGLADQADRLPRKLSGGQRQRVAIARALAGAPDLVLADEPTANLDRRTAEDIVDLLARLNRDEGVTLVAATHDPFLVDRASLRVDFLGDGRISTKDLAVAHA